MPLLQLQLVYLLARHLVLVYLFAGDRASVPKSTRFTRNHINKFGDCSPLTARSPGGSQLFHRVSEVDERVTAVSAGFPEVGGRVTAVSSCFREVGGQVTAAVSACLLAIVLWHLKTKQQQSDAN